MAALPAPPRYEAVERDHSGPARIAGGPGTGKSIVAVHRGAWLAQRSSGSVLLTTFYKTLAARLAQQVDQLPGADAAARERIDVVHLHQRAVELWRERTTETPRCWDLTVALDDSGERPYRHTVDDEVEDFDSAELRLLRALTAEGSNDIFLAGDAHKRIYKPRTSFARAGLKVRGRASVLRLNYCTTDHIRRAANHLVARTPIDEDGVTDTSGVSILSGPEPIVRTLAGVAQEIDTVAAWLRELVSTGYRPSEIGVFARTKRLAEDRGRRAIKAAHLPCIDLERDDADANGVARGTMHRAKGPVSRHAVPYGRAVQTCGDVQVSTGYHVGVGSSA